MSRRSKRRRRRTRDDRAIFGHDGGADRELAVRNVRALGGALRRLDQQRSFLARAHLDDWHQKTRRPITKRQSERERERDARCDQICEPGARGYVDFD